MGVPTSPVCRAVPAPRAKGTRTPDPLLAKYARTGTWHGRASGQQPEPVQGRFPPRLIPAPVNITARSVSRSRRLRCAPSAARRQRRALPWAGPAHAGPHPDSARRSRWLTRQSGRVRRDSRLPRSLVQLADTASKTSRRLPPARPAQPTLALAPHWHEARNDAATSAHRHPSGRSAGTP